MRQEIPEELNVVQYVPYNTAIAHYNELLRLRPVKDAYAAVVQQVDRLWSELRIRECGCHPTIMGICHLCNSHHPDRMLLTIRRYLRNTKIKQKISVDERILNRTIYEMEGITVRACNLLANIDAQTIAELIHLSREDLLKQRNCGKKTVAVIEKGLAKLGLKLRKP
jgi:hypothetical protein